MHCGIVLSNCNLKKTLLIMMSRGVTSLFGNSFMLGKPRENVIALGDGR